MIFNDGPKQPQQVRYGRLRGYGGPIDVVRTPPSVLMDSREDLVNDPFHRMPMRPVSAYQGGARYFHVAPAYGHFGDDAQLWSSELPTGAGVLALPGDNNDPGTAPFLPGSPEMSVNSTLPYTPDAAQSDTTGLAAGIGSLVGGIASIFSPKPTVNAAGQTVVNGQVVSAAPTNYQQYIPLVLGGVGVIAAIYALGMLTKKKPSAA